MKSLDQRIAQAITGDASPDNLSALIEEAEAASIAAEEASERARKSALDPATVPSEAEKASHEMESASFHRDRLVEAVRRLGEQLEVARQREENERRRAIYEPAKAMRDGVASKLKERWPKLEQELLNLLDELEEADAVVARANREVPDDIGALSSAELIARDLSCFVANGAEIPRLASMKLPAFDYTARRPMAWPRPQRVQPMFFPRWEPMLVFVREPFEHENGTTMPPRVYSGIQELPRALAERAIEAGLAVRMGTPEGREIARQIESGALVVPPASTQLAQINSTRAAVAPLDFSLTSWAQADVAEQRSEWQRQSVA